MSGVGSDILLIFGLILINGFFSGAEAALIAVRRTRVDELAAAGGIAAQTLKKLKDAPDKFLATVQVGVTLVGTLASVVSGATVVIALKPRITQLPWEFTRTWSGEIAIATVVVSIAFASLVIGELVPKYLALARPDRVALLTARPIAFFAWIGYPLVALLTAVSRSITRLFGVRPSDSDHPVSDQEIRLLAQEGSRHGSLDETERQMIEQTLDFSDTTARQIMTPRPDVSGIEKTADTDTVLRLIREEGFSRFPVYEETLDRVVGLLYTRDVIHLMTNGAPIVLADLLRTAMFVPDSMPISKVLARFQAEHRHMAIVLDEFGGTAGVVTLEDVLEEIVGDIQDEYDSEEAEFQLLDDGSALVAAGLPIIDFNEQYGAELPTDRGDTLGGLFTATLDRLPHKGDHITVHNIRFDIATLDGRRIKLLRARRLDQPGN
jgi:putative hemolysin